jgi:hypothetical protein
MGGFEADDFAPAGVIADDGSFRYTTVHEETLTLRAWPWKSPPATAHTVSCRDGDRHQLEFVVPDQGPDLSGRIVDASGDPAPNAYIDIRGLEPGTMNQQERADASGDWGVFALPPGQYAITAHVPGEGIATAWVTAPSSGVDLRLSGTGTLYGQVVGVADGATFQLEIETCLAPHAMVVVPATTRLVPVENGEFRVDDLPACRLVAHARTPTRTTTIDTDIVAGVDNAYYLDLTPPRSKRVEVSVIDARGVAVPHAQVLVAPDRGGHGAPPVTADDRGIAVVDAQVGDTIHAYAVDPDAAFARMGRGDVSDAPGSYEEIVVVLEQ